jgi:hypothetical protein
MLRENVVIATGGAPAAGVKPLKSVLLNVFNRAFFQKNGTGIFWIFFKIFLDWKFPENPGKSFSIAEKIFHNLFSALNRSFVSDDRPPDFS